MKIISASLCLLFMLTAAPNTSDRADDGWKLRIDRENIKVYSRACEGSPVDEFRGECVVDAPLMTIIGVFSDIPAFPEWIPNCREVRIIRWLDYPNSIFYVASHLPWPINDRYAILRSDLRMLRQEKLIQGNFMTVPGEPYTQDNRMIRMKEMRGKWVFEAETESTTRVLFTTMADPAGSIPAWLANYASRDLPFRTLQNLRKMVKKDKYRLKGQLKV
jgi:hypothetical protein